MCRIASLLLSQRLKGSMSGDARDFNNIETQFFFFWYQDGTLLIDYLPKGQTINAEHYSSLPVQLKDILKEKGRGKVTKAGLVLAQCSGSPATCNPQETGLAGLPKP